MKAVILAGSILPGMDEQQVWAKVAALFKLESEAFKTRVLARCPLTIKETDVDADAQRILAALTNSGAKAELIESDGSKWNLQQEGQVCGPVPLQYLKSLHQAGLLADDAQVKQAADKDWTMLWVALGAPAFTLDVPTPLDQDDADDEPPPLPPRQARAAIPLGSALASVIEPILSEKKPVIPSGKTLAVIAAVLLTFVWAHYRFQSTLGVPLSPSAQEVSVSKNTNYDNSDVENAFSTPQLLITRFNKLVGSGCEIYRFYDDINTNIRPISEFTNLHYEEKRSYFFYSKCMSESMIGSMAGNMLLPQRTYVVQIASSISIMEVVNLITSIEPNIDGQDMIDKAFNVMDNRDSAVIKDSIGLELHRESDGSVYAVITNHSNRK